MLLPTEEKILTQIEVKEKELNGTNTVTKFLNDDLAILQRSIDTKKKENLDLITKYQQEITNLIQENEELNNTQQQTVETYNKNIFEYNKINSFVLSQIKQTEKLLKEKDEELAELTRKLNEFERSRQTSFSELYAKKSDYDKTIKEKEDLFQKRLQMYTANLNDSNANLSSSFSCSGRIYITRSDCENVISMIKAKVIQNGIKNHDFIEYVFENMNESLEIIIEKTMKFLCGKSVNEDNKKIVKEFYIVLSDNDLKLNTLKKNLANRLGEDIKYSSNDQGKYKELLREIFKEHKVKVMMEIKEKDIRKTGCIYIEDFNQILKKNEIILEEHLYIHALIKMRYNENYLKNIFELEYKRFFELISDEISFVDLQYAAKKIKQRYGDKEKDLRKLFESLRICVVGNQKYYYTIELNRLLNKIGIFQNEEINTENFSEMINIEFFLTAIKRCRI